MSSESQIQILRYNLFKAKNYIKYLKKELINQDKKLDIFRIKVSNFKKYLKKVL